MATAKGAMPPQVVTVNARVSLNNQETYGEQKLKKTPVILRPLNIALVVLMGVTFIFLMGITIVLVYMHYIELKTNVTYTYDGLLAYFYHDRQ